jgi:hypothetical protein
LGALKSWLRPPSRSILLAEAALGWHFIPAFRDGRPVACRFRLRVWPLE